MLKAECPELYANYLKLIEGEKTSSFMERQIKNEVVLLPQKYLETDIYKASREIKKMQKLSSKVLTTWYDNIPGGKGIIRKIVIETIKEGKEPWGNSCSRIKIDGMIPKPTIRETYVWSALEEKAMEHCRKIRQM